MRGRRVYGQSRNDTCPFCGKLALAENKQGVPVCLGHKNSELPLLKCLCGEILEIMKGKFGVFFNCINCGNMNLRKVLEINPPIKATETTTISSIKPEKKPPTVCTPEDIDIYYS